MNLTNLTTKYLGKNCIYYKQIDSTQNEIWRLINNSIKNGTLVIADIQTKGRGTHGRVWHTDEENNIAFSFYVETNCNINKINEITIDIAKIIVNIFKQKYGIKLSIKQPNDIVYKDKKIGGILTESKVLANTVKYLVIGIGLNTNKSIFSDDIKDIATSIKREFNIEIDRDDFICEFCNRFEDCLNKKISN